MHTKFLLALIALLPGCTDAGMASFASYGEPAAIICYSGGREIYRGVSTGKLFTEQNSDGWMFKEVPTGMLVRVSGTCVIHQQTSSSTPLESWMKLDQAKLEAKERAEKSAD